MRDPQEVRQREWPVQAGSRPGNPVWAADQYSVMQEESAPLDAFKTAAKPGLLWRFLQLGLPGALMMTADASSFDITTAMAGLLSKLLSVLKVPATSTRSPVPV